MPSKMPGIRTTLGLGVAGALITIACGPEGQPITIGPVAGAEPHKTPPPAAATAEVTKTFTAVTPEATPAAAIDFSVNYGRVTDRGQADKTVNAIKEYFGKIKIAPGTRPLFAIEMVGTSGNIAQGGGIPFFLTTDGKLVNIRDVDKTISDPNTAAAIKKDMFGGAGNIREEVVGDKIIYSRWLPGPKFPDQVRQIIAVVEPKTGKTVELKKTSDLAETPQVVAFLLPDNQAVGENVQPQDITVVQLDKDYYLVPKSQTEQNAPLLGLASTRISLTAENGVVNHLLVTDTKGNQVAFADSQTGALTWNADNWKALKDTDKAQVASWLAQQKDKGINVISIAQPDGSSLIQLVYGKNLLPVKIAKDSKFEMVFDKTVKKNVTKINGTVFAWQDGNTWTLSVKTKQNELQAINTKGFLEKFPNALIAPEVVQRQGKKLLLHLVTPDGKEIVSYLKGEFVTDQGILINWDIFNRQEQLDLARFFMQNYHYTNFTLDLQNELIDRVLFWVQRFPDKLPTLDEIGLTDYVNQADYDYSFNRSAILSGIANVNTVQGIEGTTNYAGVLLADAYRGDQMAIWFFKESAHVAPGGKLTHWENVSTSLIVAIDKIMAQNGVNSGINPEFQKKRVRGEEPYPKPR